MLSLDNALRMLLCRNTEIVLEEVKWETDASPEEIEDVLNDMD
jgi:hypothetical protein